MTTRKRRPAFGTCKPFCEALDGRTLLSALGFSPENPPAEVSEPGELGPTLELVAATPATGSAVAEAVTQIRLQFDRPLDEFSLGMSVRLDRLDDGSTVWDVFETLDPDDPSTLVLNLGQALAPGSYRLVLPTESFLSGLDGAFLDVMGGDQIATEFDVVEAETEPTETDLGTLDGDILTVPGTLDLAANPDAVALYRVQISPAHQWWRIGVEVSATGDGSTLRPTLHIYSEDGRLLRTSQEGRPGIPDNSYLFAGLPAGTYLIGVSGTTQSGPVGFGFLPFFLGGPGAASPSTFSLSLVAEPAEAPTSVLGFQLGFADPNSQAPTGFALEFSGPMAPSDPSIGGGLGLEVVDARGRVWPAIAVGYNATTTRLDVLLGQRLPSGDYTVRLAPGGGLTDLAGVPPVRNGLPAGELARFRVEASPETADPRDLGALYPDDLARGIARSLSLEPGDTARFRLVVLHSGQIRFTINPSTDARLTPENGGAALTASELATQPILEPGVYHLTLSNNGTETVNTTVSLEAHGLFAESLLLNGMGQGSALNLRLVAPSGGLSAALPVAATPGPSTDSQTVAANPAPWAGALLGLVPGPIGGAPSSGDDADTAPLTTTTGPQSAGGLALGLNVEIVGAPSSQSALVAMAAPAMPGAVGNSLGQGIFTTSEVAPFPEARPTLDAAIHHALVLAAENALTHDAPANPALKPGDTGSPEAIVQFDVLAAATPADAADAGATPDGAPQVASLAEPTAEDEPEDEPTQYAAIDPCLALTAATVVAIHFRDRLRKHLGRGTQRSQAHPIPARWRHGFSPKVLNN